MSTSASSPPLLQPKARASATDQRWSADAVNQQFRDYIFTRVSAKGQKFTKVDFRYSTFENCYFRDCYFDSCDFTGCKFVGSNFHGSGFVGCKFDYTTFERTLIDVSILDTCCPAFENLKGRFARTLRANYQSLGDAAGVNKAVSIELQATGIHLYKAWRSNESYYRKKYSGVQRLTSFLAWARFRVLDFIWGNGESPFKLVRSTILFLALLALCDVFSNRDPRLVESYWAALLYVPQVFLGAAVSPFGGLFSAAIIFVRLIVFGLFVSLLVRRFAWR